MKADLYKFAKAGREIFGLNTNLSLEDTAIKGIITLRDWFESIGIKTSLVDAGIRMDEMQRIASNPGISYPIGKLKLLNE